MPEPRLFIGILALGLFLLLVSSFPRTTGYYDPDESDEWYEGCVASFSPRWVPVTLICGGSVGFAASLIF